LSSGPKEAIIAAVEPDAESDGQPDVQRLSQQLQIRLRELGFSLLGASKLGILSRSTLTSLRDAFGFGLPVVAADLPAIAELAAGDAAVLVARDDDFSAGAAAAVRGLLEDAAAAERAAVASGDRGRAFTWRDAAEQVWQLHADL